MCVPDFRKLYAYNIYQDSTPPEINYCTPVRDAMVTIFFISISFNDKFILASQI